MYLFLYVNVATATFGFGTVRLWFATDAYGMGTDVRDLRRIIHIGPPMNLESEICLT
jgi:superfamily II DNA helicase RecQ